LIHWLNVKVVKGLAAAGKVKDVKGQPGME
jgi:hypothetical protein